MQVATHEVPLLCVNICGAGTTLPLSRWVFQPPRKTALPLQLIFKCFTQGRTAPSVLVVGTCFGAVGDLLQIPLWVEQGWDVNFWNFPIIWQPDEPHPLLPFLFLFCSFKCLQTKCFIWGEWEVLFTAAKVCSAKRKRLFQITLIFNVFILLPDCQTFALPYVLPWLTDSITNPFFWSVITGMEVCYRDVILPMCCKVAPLFHHLCTSSVSWHHFLVLLGDVAVQCFWWTKRALGL